MTTNQQAHPLRRLIRYAGQHRSKIRLGIIYSVVNKIFDLAPPILIGAAVDVVVSKENSFLSYFGVVDVVQQLWLLAGITLLIWGFESLFDYIADVLWRNLAQTIQHEVRLDAYQHLQTLELAYFEDTSSGELMAVLNDDVNQLERFLDSGAHEVLQLVTTTLFVGALFVYIVPGLAWMVILPMPLIAWGSVFFQKRIAPRYAAVREQAGLINSQLSNSLGGISTVKSFTAEDHEALRLEKASIEYCEKNEKAISLSAAFIPLIRMIIVIGFAAILVYAGERVVLGTLNVGVYSILIFMTQRFLWPLTVLGKTLDLYQRAMASTNRILNVLETKARIVDGPNQLAVEQVKGAIRFEDVSFAYDSRSLVLDGLSFEIKPGESIGIVGSTGSGKTTLLKLLLRFYEATSGKIFLEEQETNSLTLESLRKAIALVSQDVFLIDGSIRENISYGSFGKTDEQVLEAAKIAEVHDFIAQLPDGYETIVGERGQKLSGGQRQRISIARAVLKDAPILILDEATSSVDNETEAAIQRAMEWISRERTMIVIAHRLSTVRNCNSILILEKGRLVEQGSHEELLGQGGFYAAQWSVQTGEPHPSRLTA